MTARNEIRMAIFLVVGIAFACVGLFSGTIRINKAEPLKGYKLLLFRVLLVALGINGIIIAFEIYNGH
jgi:hypothetical protein